ncbi:MAG TPA: ROK family protein [Baekduia sp.]|uniref:ROK family protein n=1 Tax=Baekduia sp. TaxID=2600305 RepID=UPI002D7A2E96|nr:ROK family protein [Baekduia sp.]HET6506601.1 ROK family protein [Baekduia sp.]
MTQRFIGVDVGGTKVSVAVLEGKELSEPTLRPTVLDSSDRLVDQLAELIQEAGPADAVGIGVPSVVDFATGTARHSVNVPLRDVPLRRLLTERLKMPVFVDNDATVAALAEAHDDELHQAAQSLVLFTIGTGVGGGIVIGGRIFRGATGGAAELGHQLIGADLGAGAPPHSDEAPQPGSLERLAAGRALDALGRERGFPDGPAVVTAARAGDASALEAVRILGERLGVGIANAINVFDPEQVVIGGGVSAAGELLLEPARQVARRFVLPGVGTRTEIRLARYGPRAGVRGAALLAGQEVLNS